MKEEKWHCLNCNTANYISVEVCSGCKKSCYEIDDEQHILNLIAPPDQRRSDGSNIVPYRKLDKAREAAFLIPIVTIPFAIDSLSQTPVKPGFNSETALYVIDNVIPTTLITIGALLLAIYCWSVVIDHIDRRKNEVSYYNFQGKTLKPGLILIAVALSIKIIVSEIAQMNA
jgi:hypothetical protein